MADETSMTLSILPPALSSANMLSYASRFPSAAHALSSAREDGAGLSSISTHTHTEVEYQLNHHRETAPAPSTSASPRPPTPASEVGSVRPGHHYPSDSHVQINYQYSTPPLRHLTHSSTPVPFTHHSLPSDHAHPHSHSHPATPPSYVPFVPSGMEPTPSQPTSAPSDQTTFDRASMAFATPPARLSQLTDPPATWPPHGTSGYALQPPSHRPTYGSTHMPTPGREYEYEYEYDHSGHNYTHGAHAGYDYGHGYMHPPHAEVRWDPWYNYHQPAEKRERDITRLRKHVCPVCDKRFNRPSSLSTHMSVHTGAKPYQCQREGCGRRFSVSSNLRRHERTHEARVKKEDEHRPLPPYPMYLSTPPMTSGHVPGIVDHGTPATTMTTATTATASSIGSVHSSGSYPGVNHGSNANVNANANANTNASANGNTNTISTSGTGTNSTSGTGIGLGGINPTSTVHSGLGLQNCLQPVSQPHPFDYTLNNEGLRQYAIIGASSTASTSTQATNSTTPHGSHHLPSYDHGSPQSVHHGHVHSHSHSHSHSVQGGHSIHNPHGHGHGHGHNGHSGHSGHSHSLSAPSVPTPGLHSHGDIRAPRSLMLGSV